MASCVALWCSSRKCAARRPCRSARSRAGATCPPNAARATCPIRELRNQVSLREWRPPSPRSASADRTCRRVAGQFQSERTGTAGRPPLSFGIGPAIIRPPLPGGIAASDIAGRPSRACRGNLHDPGECPACCSATRAPARRRSQIPDSRRPRRRFGMVESAQDASTKHATASAT